MSEVQNEKLPDGRVVQVKIWKDKQFKYISYFLPYEDFEYMSEQALIKIVSKFESFSSIPAEYTRQVGVSEEEDENGDFLLQLTFVLENLR